MNVGMIGLGKLGLPIAVALAEKFNVRGYDIFDGLMKKRHYEHQELGPTLSNDFQKHFDKSPLQFATLQETVEKSDIVFVAVQTPHQPMYEGVTRLPNERVDFDYSHLIKSVTDVAAYIKPHQTLAIISTVLPGTIAKHIEPLVKCNLVYNPFFIAMGTVIYDFYNPEFVLLGSRKKTDLTHIKTLYDKLQLGLRTKTMSIESAELTKVAYNTFISFKIAFANTIGEIAHKTPGCDVSEVTSAIKQATKRLISPAYLNSGMGDGGSCHPRDCIAMSSLARRLNLGYDLFESMMMSREAHAQWLVDLMLTYNLPKVIIGKAFKPETDIITGSPSILCANLLAERNVEFEIWDPVIDQSPAPLSKPAVFLIGTKHQAAYKLAYPAGSVVIDPHACLGPRPGITVVPVGRCPI